MSILNQLHPSDRKVVINGEEWVFPYVVFHLIELEDRIIVSYSWSDIEKNPPAPDFYIGCTVWCYDKKNKEVLWIIEEPPSVYGPNGEDLGKIRGFSNYFPNMRIDECYLDISYNKIDNVLDSDTTGARRFMVDPETGKVTLIATGVR